MNYNITSLPKSEIEIEVILSFSEFEPHVKRAAGFISEENEIEGFRRGKAPYEIVKNRFGESIIYEKAAEIAVRKTYPEILEKLTEEGKFSKERPPIGRPQVTITKLAPDNEFVYKVRLAQFPEVNLPDYKAIAERIRKDKKEVHASDEEVERTLEWVRESRAALITVEKPAEMGDRVEIDFEIRHGGVKISEGESKNHPLILGRGKFIPGFEDKILGMKSGEEKEFSLVVPENWHEKSLVGKEIKVSVKMKLVQERKVPELDDGFVKSLGNFSSAEDFKKSVKEGLLQEKKEKETQRIRALIIEEVAKAAKADIPDTLVEGEREKMIQELRSGVEGGGIAWEEYLGHIKKSEEELRKDFYNDALLRVRIGLCLREIADREKIEPSEEEIKIRADEFLKQFKTAGQAEKSIDTGELLEYTKGVLRNEQVFEFLERA